MELCVALLLGEPEAEADGELEAPDEPDLVPVGVGALERVRDPLLDALALRLGLAEARPEGDALWVVDPDPEPLLLPDGDAEPVEE